MFQFISRLNLDRLFMCAGFGMACIAAAVVWSEKAPLVSASQITKANSSHLQTVYIYDAGKTEEGSKLRLECILDNEGKVYEGLINYQTTSGDYREAMYIEKDRKAASALCKTWHH